MLNVKKLVSSCLAVVLIMGIVCNGNVPKVLASESDENYVSSFIAEIAAEAQCADGSIHGYNDYIQPGTVLEVTTEYIEVHMSIKGEELIFQNSNGELCSNVVGVEEDGEGNAIRTYSISIDDITERIITQVPADDEDMGESEVFIAFIVDDNILNSINEVQADENSTKEDNEGDDADVEGVLLTEDSGNDDNSNTSEATASLSEVDGEEESGTMSLSATSASELTNGEYSIEIEARELDSDSVHLRNSDLESTAKLIVSGDTIEFYFSSHGRELTFLSSDGETYENKTVSSEDGSGDIRSDGYDTTTVRNYKLTLSSIDEKIVAKFPAGGSATGALTYRIVLLENTLTAVNVESDDDSDNDDSSSGTTSGNSSSGSSSSGSSSSGSSSSGSSSSGSSSSSSTAKTGDDTNVLYMVLVLITSGCVGSYAVYLKKRESLDIRYAQNSIRK